MHRKHVFRAAVVCALFPGALPPNRAQIPPGYELVQITDDPDFDRGIQINDCGQIVFAKRLNNDWAQSEIFLYDNGRTVQLTRNGDYDAFPVINNLGVVAWCRGTGGTECRSIFVLEGLQELQIATGRRFAFATDINDANQIAWMDFAT